MKKVKFILTVFLLSSFLPSLAEAAYGPYLSLELGEDSRRIEENCVQCFDSAGNEGLKFYGNADSTRLLAIIGLNLRSIDIYVALGGATLSIEEFDGYHGKMTPAYGGGVKMTMYESPTYEHFKIFVNPNIMNFKTNDVIFFSSCLGAKPCNSTVAVPVSESHEISWTEYGVKVGGAARYDFLEPYGGVSLSFLNGEESGAIFGTADIKESDNLGFFLGANYYFDPTGQASLYGEIGGGDNGYVKVGIKTRF